MNSQDSSSASPFPSTEDLELLRYLVGDTGISPDSQPVLRRRTGTSMSVLSFAQERLWFLAQFEPDKPLYNVRLMTYLHGTLNLSALSASLLEIIRRHEVLRTTFQMEGYEPVQHIHASIEMHFPFIDLSGLPPIEQEQYLRQLASVETQKVFDLAHGPLLRGMVLQLQPQKYLLFLTLHHIIADGWSMGVLLQELNTYYSGFVEGRSLPLTELPLQYADFASWQRQILQGDQLSRLLTYWRTQLAGAAPLLPLPIDHPRPARQSYAGAMFELPLSLTLTAQLKALSQREGVTLFMTLLAAFQALLARYSNCEDILVGTPIANRTHKELEGLIGFFVNTLVLRIDLSGNPSVRQLLQRVRHVALQAYAHQDLPFERLVEELQPERNLSYHPLFQVLFQFDNTPLSTLTLPQLSLEPLNLEKETTLFDLHLLLFETEQGLTAHFEYNTDLFEAATIQRMAGHFQVLLESLSRDLEQSIGELPLLSNAEREQLLISWNATNSPYPERPLHSFFEEQTQRSPMSVAVLFEGQELSYLELNRLANRLAHRLRRSGVGPDVPVGLYVERSLEMLIGILGILKAGGAYVPLDPSYPLQRLSYMLNDAQAPLLLTHASLLNRLPACQVQVLLIEEATETTDEDNPITGVTPDHLAYIIYTSGSTGNPKGVCLPHRALTNLLYWHQQTLNKGCRTLQFASFSFDASIHEMFAAWCSGGTLLLLSEALRQDMVALAQFLIEQRVEKTILPVVVLQQLAELYHKQEQLPRSLREVITTGEQLYISPLVRELFQRLEDCHLYNHYGPSETHVVISYTLPDDPALWPTYPPLGRPIANTQAYVLDQDLQPVPVGVSGELYLGGDNLARGYLNQSELTASRFLTIPAIHQASRLYKTGDLVRFLPDGNLLFLGRRDRQVKLRGFRIELEELVSVLCKHPDIYEAFVDIQEDHESNQQKLVAYIVPAIQRIPVLGGRRRYTLPNRLSVAYLDREEADLLYYTSFERQFYREQGLTITAGDCIFDLGANIGLFSLWATQQVQHLQLYAFEEDLAAYKVLQINTQLYAPQTSVFLYSSSDAASSSGQSMASPSQIIERCQIERIDWLRIALPGQTTACIQALEQRDWLKIQHVLVEIKEPQEQAEQIEVLLQERGFSTRLEREESLADDTPAWVVGTREEQVAKFPENAELDAPAPGLQEYPSLLTVQEVRHFLLQELPGYMLPSAFVFLEALPLNTNGKVDREALPREEISKPELGSDFVAPRTALEERLAAVWTRLFQMQQISIYDTFFDLGGHSLLATKLIAQLQDTFQVQLPVRDLFENPTIAGLAASVELALLARGDVQLPPDEEQDSREEIIL